jgi:hypothetical protein
VFFDGGLLTMHYGTVCDVVQALSLMIRGGGGGDMKLFQIVGSIALFIIISYK